MAARPADTNHAYGAGRVTVQRSIIVETAAQIGGAFTVDDLAVAARERDTSVGVATVYRAVAALEETGWLERVGERAGSTLYARCLAGGSHHHHVICTTCGRIEAAECPLGPSTSSAETPSGFVLTGHEVTLYGLCPDCVAGGQG